MNSVVVKRRFLSQKSRSRVNQNTLLLLLLKIFFLLLLLFAIFDEFLISALTFCPIFHLEALRSGQKQSVLNMEVEEVAVVEVAVEVCQYCLNV